MSQIKGILEREKFKESEFTVTESVAELDSSSANVKRTENDSKIDKIDNDLVKQQQEIKDINQQLATILKLLSEKTSTSTSTESLSAPAVVARPTRAERQQKSQERQNKRDAYYESNWQAGVEDAGRSSEVLDKLQEKFANDNLGVVINSAKCSDSSCKISLDYTLGKSSPLLEIRNQFLGKDLYFSKKNNGTDGQRSLTVYVTE